MSERTAHGAAANRPGESLADTQAAADGRRSPVLAARAWLRTLPTAGRWILQGSAAAREPAARVFGVGFSQIACRALLAGHRATLWLGPDEYLLLDLDDGDAGLAGAKTPATADVARTTDALEDALRGVPHALVDIGHRQFALEVSGVHSHSILSAFCPLDLDAGAFPVGMCTRTVFAKADIVLWRTRSDAFHLEIWRSFAGYVGGLLEEVAGEYYPNA